MSDKAFARAINQIAAEDQQQRLAEREAGRRRHLIARVRKYCLAVVGLALVGVAFAYRVEVGQQLSRLTESTKPTDLEKTQADLAKNVDGIRENAAKRDKVLDELQTPQK